MNRNRWINIFIIILGSSWCMAVPYYGFMWSSLVQRYDVDPSFAQTLLLCTHYLTLLLLSFFVNVRNVRKITAVGFIGSFFLSMLMWFLPLTQAYYISYGLLGATTGMFYAGFCILFIYGFGSDIRIKVTAVYLFGMYSLTYALSYLLKTVDKNIAFALLSLLLLGAVYLLKIFDAKGLAEPDSIEAGDFPLKLLVIMGLVLFIGYFNNGMIVINVFNFYGPEGIQHSAAGIEQILLLLSYLLFFFAGNRVNRFAVLYFSFIFIGLTYISCILYNGPNTTAGITSALSYSFFHLFTFSFVADISLKYGRSLGTFRASVLVVAVGAITGELVGKASDYYLAGNHVLLFGISLTVLLVSLLLVPWLTTYITLEMEEKKPEAPQIGTDTAEIAVEEKEISALDKLKLVNSYLPEYAQLTAKELEVAAFLMERHDYKTISEKMFISVNTLKVHIKHIYKKLQVSSKKELFEAVEGIYANNTAKL